MAKENKKLMESILEKMKWGQRFTKKELIRLRKNKKPKNSKHIVVSLIGKSPISIPTKLKKEWGNELKKLNAVTYMLEKYKEIWMHNPDKLSKVQFVKKYGNLFSQQYVIEEKARYAKTEPGERKWLKDVLQPFVDNIEKLIYAPKKFSNIFLNLKDVVKRIIARQKLTKEEVNAIKYLFQKEKDWKASKDSQRKVDNKFGKDFNPRYLIEKARWGRVEPDEYKWFRNFLQPFIDNPSLLSSIPENFVSKSINWKDVIKRIVEKQELTEEEVAAIKYLFRNKDKQPEVNPKLRLNNAN
jgi:hypothetical protein